MKRFSKIVATLALPVVMSGCASFPGTTHYLDDLKATQPSGPAFTQALSREYLAFAESQKNQYSWFNSWHFAKKGLDAAHGVAVPPENPADWDVGGQPAADLAAARTRLLRVLDGAAPRHLPSLTATAQVKYDCWVEEQDRGWKTADIAACRQNFLAAMSALETPAKAEAPVAAPLPRAAHVAPKAGTDRFQLFFDLNRSRLSADALHAVKAAARAAKAAGYPKLTIIGYTDASGSADLDLKLSLKRAEAVRQALIENGVPADRLSAEGRGKTDLLVATKNGAPEAQNRRVVIRFP